MGRGAWKRGDFAGSAKRWGSGYRGASQAIKDGVDKTDKDPTALAGEHAADAVREYARVVTSDPNGPWRRGLARAGKAGWQKGMKDFADNGLGIKAEKGEKHFLPAAQALGQATMQQVAQLPARQATGNNDARVTQMNRWQHEQRGKYRKLWRGG